jgi:hypothetical protein
MNSGTVESCQLAHVVPNKTSNIPSNNRAFSKMGELPATRNKILNYCVIRLNSVLSGE